ncbi:hypothetical protein WJ972_11000 [Achromobacter insuavis]
MYFLFGLAGTVMIATGAVLYAVKRRARHDGAFGAATPVFQRVVESLNVAAIAGGAVACIAYFHGNRLIPADCPRAGSGRSGCSSWPGWRPCCTRCSGRRRARGASSSAWRRCCACRCRSSMA